MPHGVNCNGTYTVQLELEWSDWSPTVEEDEMSVPRTSAAPATRLFDVESKDITLDDIATLTLWGRRHSLARGLEWDSGHPTTFVNKMVKHTPQTIKNRMRLRYLSPRKQAISQMHPEKATEAIGQTWEEHTCHCAAPVASDVHRDMHFKAWVPDDFVWSGDGEDDLVEENAAATQPGGPCWACKQHNYTTPGCRMWGCAARKDGGGGHHRGVMNMQHHTCSDCRKMHSYHKLVTEDDNSEKSICACENTNISDILRFFVLNSQNDVFGFENCVFSASPNNMFVWHEVRSTTAKAWILGDFNMTTCQLTCCDVRLVKIEAQTWCGLLEPKKQFSKKAIFRFFDLSVLCVFIRNGQCRVGWIDALHFYSPTPPPLSIPSVLRRGD